MRLSVVVPVLDEAPLLAGALDALAPLRARGHEVIVADGGSTDGSVSLARARADAVIDSPRGRALQMNAGAARAAGDVLLFLHADTRLPEGADRIVVEGLRRTGRRWGRFDVTIEGRSRVLGLVGGLMNLRSRLTGMATGDQAIFVRRGAFEAAGGYPAIPLMEDLALSRALKRLGAPLCLRERVRTSGRRWEQRGVARTILLMWRLRLQYFLSADPWRLARAYAGRPPASACAVVVFARAPVAGEAKTRLIPRLGAEGAAALHERLVRHALGAAVGARIGPVQLWCAPDRGHAFFRACAAEFGVTLHDQGPGDLGERMERALRQALRDAPRAVLIGADVPAMTADTLREAGRLLNDADVVLGPAEDGGYVLLGLRRPAPALFGAMAWGEASVLDETRRRIAALGLSRRELAPLWDVDRPEDLERLAAGRSPAPQATARRSS